MHGFNFTYTLQESSIIDFYPTNFKIDLNGKKYAWQGVALLPFVEEKRLWEALAPVYNDLTEEEGNDLHIKHYSQFLNYFKDNCRNKKVNKLYKC